MSQVSDIPRQGHVTAVLGPTNTGKTHHAVTRMLANPTGMIGLPLRLLAREVYDRVVAQAGQHCTALITGEEKIIPKNVRFWVCTVESMPMDLVVDFLAIDEIQLAQDPERGHVFTDRILHARGRHETMLMGSLTMAPILQRLLPDLEIHTRQRLSDLSYAGIKKISRLPRRSAIVAFSANDVYEIAELIRRQKGGAAVVLGALSPRTRNAQVALYEDGEVDYLVATDAIGMGLNMDVHHVAFAGLDKFDGKMMRRLRDDELAQIAGRAGRNKRDGSFGTTGLAEELGHETIDNIQDHMFEPVTQLCWRNGKLDFRGPDLLLKSLDRPSSSDLLTRGREASDAMTLRQMARDMEVRDRANGIARMRLLWDVAQIPDFRKTLQSEHVQLLVEAYLQLTARDQLDEDWISGHVERLDRQDGGIDALQTRLAFIRTWTYMSHRPGWLKDALHWQNRTRNIEDRLSDALHESLMGRFVDRRTSVLMKRLREKQDLMADVDDEGQVTVEGELLGKIDGFRFAPAETSGDVHAKTLRAAAAQVLADQLTKRANQLAGAKNPISVDLDGSIRWANSIIGQLEKGDAPLRPRVVLYTDDHMPNPIKEKLQAHLDSRVADEIDNRLGSLKKLEAGSELTPSARALAYRLYEGKGCLMRRDIQDLMGNLQQEDRQGLRAMGTRFAQHAVYLPLLLKPHALTLKAVLWALHEGRPAITPPPPGLVTIERDATLPDQYYHENGFMPFKRVAARVDMTDRLTEAVRKECDREDVTPKGHFIITPELMSLVGRSGEDFEDILMGLGYRETVEFKPEPQETQQADEGQKPEAQGFEAAHGAAPAPGKDGDEVTAAGSAGDQHLDDAEGKPGNEEASLQPEQSDEAVAVSDAPLAEVQEREPQNAEAHHEGEEEAAKPVMLWRFRAPRPQQARNAAAKGEGADPASRPQRSRPPKNEQGSNNRPKPGGGRKSEHRQGKPQKEQANKKPEKTDKIDPDSPFAVLAKFKS